MEIQIDGQYWLRSDERNLILSRKRITKEGLNAGQESWENVGYYTTLSGFMKGCLDQQIRVSDADTLAKLERDYKAGYTALQKVCRELDEYLKDLLKKGAVV